MTEPKLRSELRNENRKKKNIAKAKLSVTLTRRCGVRAKRHSHWFDVVSTQPGAVLDATWWPSKSATTMQSR